MKSPTSKSGARIAFLLIILIASTSISLGLQSFIVIRSDGSIYYPPEPKILFEDEFESGDFSVWSGAYTTSGDNATVVSINPYEGVYHGCFQTGAITSGVKYAYSYVELSPPASEVFARGYFYIAEGLPLDDSGDRFGLIGFEVNGQIQSTLRIYRSGGVDRFNIVGLNGSSAVQKSSDAVYPVEGRWYCLEFYIKVHGTRGEYRAWINGVERIALTNLDTASYGNGVSRVRFGLTSSVNAQHYVEVYCDSVVISTRYVGQLRYIFGVIGSVEKNPAIRNFHWLFGNQSISYRAVLPYEVTNFADVDRFDGLVVWTKDEYGYNATAVKHFAKTRIVISHVWDFCNRFFPDLSGSIQEVSTNTVTYIMDWGNFRAGDKVEMRNETGNVDRLTTVLTSGLSNFSNVTIIAQYDADRVAFFHMNGTQSKSGFYVMDLDATTPETEWAGIWHLFPAIKMVRDFPTGRYARWMANGRSWWSLTWVYNYIDELVSENDDIAEKWVIGVSVQGQNITAIVIGRGGRNIIIDGCIHGNEKSTTFAALRIAELLINRYRSDSWWRSKLENDWRIIIIPVLNPDGFVANKRENANGKDLNRQFPPGSNTTEPEAWALRWLMGNYTPTVYVNLHEGYYWYPNWLIYGNYETDPNRTITVKAMQLANETFVSLRHWGWFNEQGKNVWIGKVVSIAKGGINSITIAYASWQYSASCMLIESIVWSSKYGARQSLWAIDYYCTLVLTFLQNNSRLL
ncbi:MAG: M14 family metallopeptidase [Nitrososphaeria archaeon]